MSKNKEKPNSLYRSVITASTFNQYVNTLPFMSNTS